MENPPDLIVAVKSDDSFAEKRKFFDENLSREQNQERDELLASLQSDKYALECELQQLRAQQAMQHRRNSNSDEFYDQSRLVQQRFQDEIQYVIYRQKELVQQTTADLTIYINNILQKTIEDIESLRLLHQKELCTQTNSMNDCLEQQSTEMTELCHQLLAKQQENPLNLFSKIVDNFQIAFRDLKTSFDSKINYLNDIHSTTIEKLTTKHQNEINELQCEFNLISKQ